MKPDAPPLFWTTDAPGDIHWPLEIAEFVVIYRISLQDTFSRLGKANVKNHLPLFVVAP